jgi:hypothetical protein
VNHKNILLSSLLFVGSVLATPVFATTTYNYTDSANSIYSGSFSVSSALADGSYSFLSPASQPAGFTENFFTASFVDGSGVTRTPSLSLFDITIQNGLVSTWDIRATTLFTMVTYSGGKHYSPVYHTGSTLIYHDTNLPYLPGGGLAYQASIPIGDYETYYTSGFGYQESLTGLNYGPGVWSIASTISTGSPAPVPEPGTLLLLAAGLAGLGFAKKRFQK